MILIYGLEHGLGLNGLNDDETGKNSVARDQIKFLEGRLWSFRVMADWKQFLDCQFVMEFVNHVLGKTSMTMIPINFGSKSLSWQQSFCQSYWIRDSTNRSYSWGMEIRFSMISSRSQFGLSWGEGTYSSRLVRIPSRHGGF
jgi:hypothetical protein